jgi:hypothetical protein
MPTCEVTAHLENNCADQFGTGGVNDIVYVADKIDVTAVTLNTDNSIKDITFSAGEGFWKIENAQYQGAALDSPVNNSGMKSYNHQIDFVLSRSDQAALNRWHELRGGNFYVMIQSNRQNAGGVGINPENRIYLYGYSNGLRDAQGDGSKKGPGQETPDTIGIKLSGLQTFPEREIIPDNPTPIANPIAAFIQSKLHP